MPRALKIVIACDQCSEEIEGAEEQHPGALAIAINGGPVKQIDLCGACLNGGTSYLYVAGLLSIYEQADAIPQAKPAAKRNTNGNPAQCPACDHVAGSPQGLGRHTRTAHGVTVGELRDPAVVMAIQRRDA